MTDDGTSRKPGPASTLEKVHEALVAAATERLYEVGTEIGLGSIRLSEAIETVGVPRATAYRSLADDELSPQDRLRRDVLVRVLERDTRRENFAAVSEAVGRELEVQAANLHSADVADRTRALRALLRVGCDVTIRRVESSSERAILTAAMGVITSHSGSIPKWQVDALITGERSAIAQFDEMISSFATMFDLKLRPGLTVKQVATASAALVEGLSVRNGISDELDGVARPTGEDGAIEFWTLYGMAFEALVMVFYEPVNPDDPFADLANH